MAPRRNPPLADRDPPVEIEIVEIGVLHRAYRPGPICQEDSWAVISYSRRTLYVAEAWSRAQVFYVYPSIIKHVGEDFLELFKGIIPGLLIAFGGIITTTGVGAVLGGVIGGIFTAGPGAVPGAIYGGELGFTVGLWLLEFLGLAVLAVYVGSAFYQAGQHIKQGIKRAWTSCGSSAAIDAGARDFGEAFGHFFDVIFQALVAFVAEEGIAVALRQLNKSKIIVGLGKFFRTKLFKEATISYWLEKLGRPGEPKMVRERVGAAIEFIRDQAKGPNGQGFPSKKTGEVLSGIDFNAPAGDAGGLVGSMKPGERLVQRPDARWGGGNWFTKAGRSAADTGLAQGTRGYKVYEVVRPFEALESRASGIRDTWTTGRNLPAEMAEGGGTQLFAEKSVQDLVDQGFLKELYARTSTAPMSRISPKTAR